jgi:hypothetical protein
MEKKNGWENVQLVKKKLKSFSFSRLSILVVSFCFAPFVRDAP